MLEILVGVLVFFGIMAFFVPRSDATPEQVRRLEKMGCTCACIMLYLLYTFVHWVASIFSGTH